MFSIVALELNMSGHVLIVLSEMKGRFHYSFDMESSCTLKGKLFY